MEDADKTVGSIVQFFEKLITDFSWRRLGFVAGVLALVCSVAIVYELYTQSFKLDRLDREAALVERVIEIDKSSDQVSNKDILSAVNGLNIQVRNLLQLDSEATTVSPIIRKGLFSLLPWLIIALLIFFFSRDGSGHAILGMAIFALPLTLINISIPSFNHSWMNNWLIPWAEITGVIVLVLAWQKSKK